MNRLVHSERRQQLARLLREAGGGIAIVPTAPERTRNSDIHHPFRHGSHFHYLSGFDEPSSWLLIRSDGHSILFCRTHSPELEIWDGRRLGPEAAPAALGVQEAFPFERLDELLPPLLHRQATVWSLFDAQDDDERRLAGWLSAVRAQARHGIEGPTARRDLGPLLSEMRLIKDPIELATMRQAADISAGAHVRAMRFCAGRFKAEPAGGVHEYEIEAELLHEFRRHGAQSPAYTTIVAAGANACVLHYAAGGAELRAGELCLVDAGCELDGYASDITRTFPADGRFTGPQRELYEIVLAAQVAAVAATRPGARQRAAHDAAVRVLAQGMLDTGLLDRSAHGGVDDVVASAAYRQFYMHGTGHWLGRDVHDVGEYLALDEDPVEQPDGLGNTVVKKPSRVLQPGMVVTLEPGLYVRPAEGVPAPYWNIGIRIEDDAVITSGGCELISRGAPVTAGEIEALMAEAAEVSAG
jgi:Xaa-Pro aminopeptidase